MRRLFLDMTQYGGPLEWERSLTESVRALGRRSVWALANEWQFSAFADPFEHIGWCATTALTRPPSRTSCGQVYGVYGSPIRLRAGVNVGGPKEGEARVAIAC